MWNTSVAGVRTSQSVEGHKHEGTKNNIKLYLPLCFYMISIFLQGREYSFTAALGISCRERARREVYKPVYSSINECQVDHWINPWRPTHGVCGQRGNAYQSTNNLETATILWTQETNISLTPSNQHWAPTKKSQSVSYRRKINMNKTSTNLNTWLTLLPYVKHYV